MIFLHNSIQKLAWHYIIIQNLNNKVYCRQSGNVGTRRHSFLRSVKKPHEPQPQIARTATARTATARTATAQTAVLTYF